ncbi:hypothetical protein E4U21_006338 [Claviceps maximensis]|nr:hypothetical protein E4U21_006338 [Claviceps maximensis]
MVSSLVLDPKSMHLATSCCRLSSPPGVKQQHRERESRAYGNDDGGGGGDSDSDSDGDDNDIRGRR